MIIISIFFFGVVFFRCHFPVLTRLITNLSLARTNNSERSWTMRRRLKRCW
jgi:hypothetical protein